MDEPQRKAAIAKSILDDVVDSSNHEDEKIGRLIYSMSFLTVAAAVAYSAFVTNSIRIPRYGVDLVSSLFLVYLTFLVVGTIMMLEAMSPRLHFRADREFSSDDLQSMHFYKSIARQDLNKWLATFSETSSAELYARERDEALRQAHFLSHRITEKIGFIRKAKWAMLFAALTIVAMVAAGIITYL